jgi:hypothetical protein
MLGMMKNLRLGDRAEFLRKVQARVLDVNERKKLGTGGLIVSRKVQAWP